MTIAIADLKTDAYPLGPTLTTLFVASAGRFFFQVRVVPLRATNILANVWLGDDLLLFSDTIPKESFAPQLREVCSRVKFSMAAGEFLQAQAIPLNGDFSWDAIASFDFSLPSALDWTPYIDPNFPGNVAQLQIGYVS